MIRLGYMLLKPHALKGRPYPAAISISADACDTVPGPWCLPWSSAAPRPADFTPAEAKALSQFASPAFGAKWGWPDLIFDRSWAYELHQNWTRAKGYRLYAIACRPEDATRIVTATVPPPQLPGYAPMGEMGIHTGATRAESLADPAQPSGWQLVRMDALLPYRDILQDKALARAGDGLLPDEATAIALERKASESGKGAHPLPWIPLALIQLPNHEAASVA